jgi:hypothetical protein
MKYVLIWFWNRLYMVKLLNTNFFWLFNFDVTCCGLKYV